MVEEMLFRTKSQQIRDSIYDHEKMEASFGPRVDTNPSPSDPLAKSNLVTWIISDTCNSEKCTKTKTMHLGKLILGCVSCRQARECFGSNTQSDLQKHATDFFGRLMSSNINSFFCFYLSETNKSEKMPYEILLKVFDSEDLFRKSDSADGETIISIRFQYVQTVSKFLSYIYSKLGVSVGLEEILPIRGDLRLIHPADDLELSSKIHQRQMKNKKLSENSKAPALELQTIAV